MKTQLDNHGNLLDDVVDLTKPAIIEVDDVGRHQIYNQGEMVNLINAVASGLNNLGIGPGDRVGIVSVNSAKFICTYYGILKTGAVAVLINVSATPSQLEHIILDSKLKFIFTDQDLNTELPTIHFQSTFDNFLIHKLFCSYQPTKSDIALILYTSGSTGLPKGVPITHFARNLKIKSSKFDNHSMVCISATPCHSNAGLYTVEQCLFSKIPLVLLQKFKADVFLKAIHDHNVTSVVTLPTMINLINKEINLCVNSDLSRVADVTLSAEPVTQSIGDTVKKIFPNAKLHVGYGSTEGGSAMFGRHPSLPVPELSVGYPLPEILYRIVDGILQVKSPYMMKQYTLESGVFTEDGYYITNDLFEIDENGFYYCQGRADEIFKSGGNKISPAEIEQILLGHADVNQVSIVAVADDIKGLKPYAFAVIEKDSKVTEQELLKYCSQHLTPYQIPRRIWLVESIPVNSAGKIDRARLKIQAQQLVQV